MKKLPSEIDNCYECPFVVLVADIGFGMMYSFTCRFLWEKIPDEGILNGCPLNDDTSDIRQEVPQ